MSSTTHRLTAVLDLRDRLTSRLRGAIRQTNNFRDANGRLRNSLGRFVAETHRAGSAFSRFARTGINDSGRMRGSLDRMGSGMWGLVAAIGAAVSGAKLLGATLGKAMEFEMASATITAMFQGDTKGADAYMSMISDRAIGSPLYNEADYFQNSKSFLSQSKDTEELEKMWSLAERLGAMDPAQGIEGAVFALRELMSGDGVSMVKRFEMPRSVINDIKKMAIPEQLEAMNALMTKMGFGEEFLEKVSDTGLAFKNQIAELFAKSLREIGAEGLEKLKPQMKEFLALMNTPAFHKFKENIAESFASAVGSVSSFVVYVVKNWGTIKPIIQSLGVAVLAIAIGIGIASGSIATAIATIFSPIFLIGAAIGLLYYAFKTNFMGITTFVTPFVNMLKGSFETAKKVIESFFMFIGGDSAGSVGLLTKMFEPETVVKIVTAFQQIRSVFSTLKGAFTQVSTVVKAFFQYFTGDAVGAVGTLTKMFSPETVVKIVTVFQAIKAVVTTVMDYIKNRIQVVMENIVPFLQSGWIIIKGIFQTVAPIIMDVIGIAWNFISQVISETMPHVLSVIQTVWTTVISVFMTVWNYIAEVMPMIQTIITVVWTVLVPIISGALQSIWAIIKAVFSIIWSIVVVTFTNIKNAISLSWTVISGLFKAALQLLTGDFKGAWETLKTMASEGIEKVKVLFKGFVDGAKKIGMDFIQGIIDGFLGLGTSMINTAQGIWDAVSGIFSKKQTISVGVQTSGMNVGGTNYYRGYGHASGLNYVPYDGYQATLHKGERVMTPEENKAGSGFSIAIAKLADQIIVREEADIDKITDGIVHKLIEAGGQMA